MKAMILAAGEGRRMLPLTATIPKPLLQVAGRPLIEHHILRLHEAGFREIVVNVSHLARQLVDFLGTGDQWGVTVSLSKEASPLETAGGIVQALSLLDNKPFVLVNGDIFTDYPFSRLHDLNPEKAGAHIVLVPNPAHRPEGDFLFSGRSVKALPVEAGLTDSLRGSAPESAPASGADQPAGTHSVSGFGQDSTSASSGISVTYSGIGVYDPAMFQNCLPGKRPLKPLLDTAIADGALTGELYEGLWEDVGTPERLTALNHRFPSDSANQ